MTQGIPPPERRRVGWTAPGTPLWRRRYTALKAEGFVHEEAARLATGIIGSKAMRKGRRARKKWYRDAMGKLPAFTQVAYEDAVDDMYDEFDWADPWTQFYPEEE